MQGDRKRLTKEELHDDEFTTTMFRLLGYVESNYTKILAAICAVVVILLIGYFAQQSSQRHTQAALEALGDVQVALMQGNTSSAITKAQSIARDYAGEDSEGRALVMLANIYFDQGRYDEASSHYRKFLDATDDKSGPQVFGAWSGLASAMEAQGNWFGAAQQFVTYADQHSKTAFAPFALKEAGRCYRSAGNLDDAKLTYLRIRADYPKSPEARFAATELAMLGTLVE